MKDSGLAGVLSSVYGENTVKQIFSGHQYSRAVRAHTLVLLALSKIIFRRAEDKCENVQECVQFITEYSFMSPEDIEELQKDDNYRTITAEFEKELERIEGLNSPCKLWVQYCRMAFIVKDFLYAEKSGDLQLHLDTIERMLPFFHTTGHFPYAKSAHVYLKDMKTLEKHMSESEYKIFTTEGYWTIRGSDKFFSGIFTDQTIEQTFMRLLKFEGGLFRRGVTESVAHQWIQTFFFTKDLIEGVEKFTNCASAKNYQHKHSTDSRIEADL